MTLEYTSNRVIEEISFYLLLIKKSPLLHIQSEVMEFNSTSSKLLIETPNIPVPLVGLHGFKLEYENGGFLFDIRPSGLKEGRFRFPDNQNLKIAQLILQSKEI